MAIHLLGIRHHGPGSCRNVLEYLQELQPDLILLEGPAEAETLLPCVLNENHPSPYSPINPTSHKMRCSIRLPNSLRNGRR